MTNLLVIVSFLISFNGLPLSNPTNSTDSLASVLEEVEENVGEPLYLTPLLEEGNIRKARQLSSVKHPNLTDIRSFSGFFTVNKSCESNLFFWFFPAQRNWRNAPVVLWLQGGPGTSSLLGLFREIGPILFNGTLEKRQYSWNVKNNLLFIDQPVGTGFSFTRKKCYAKNETDVSRDVYSALTQFYLMFPFLETNKFYVTGESYAGHYAPSIAYHIHRNNPSAKSKIKLSGLMIGNGLMDIMHQSDYSSYLYQLGLVDDRQRELLQNMEMTWVDYLKKKNWKSASRLVQTHLIRVEELLGNINRYNYNAIEKDEVLNAIDLWTNYIASPIVRRTIHVGNSTFGRRTWNISYSLSTDDVKSVKAEVEELLEHYPVVFYSGQLDTICPYPLAVNFFRNLQWSGADDYLQAERHQWCVEDQLAGYFKSAHNLHEVLVRAAGHLVPEDQPLWAFELMNSVTSSPARDPFRQLRTCGDRIV